MKLLILNTISDSRNSLGAIQSLVISSHLHDTQIIFRTKMGMSCSKAKNLHPTRLIPLIYKYWNGSLDQNAQNAAQVNCVQFSETTGFLKTCFNSIFCHLQFNLSTELNIQCAENANWLWEQKGTWQCKILQRKF